LNDAVASLKAAAHEYRSRGWRVIQLHRIVDDQGTCSCMQKGKCKSAGKHPRDNEWQNTPPWSAADIETGWERWNWNVGIATGDPSGFWVLDIDPDGGGMEAMAALVAEHGRLPETRVFQTGSGGYHYCFEMPTGFEIRNSQGRVGKGIDTRGTGGQIVAPPSVSSKGAYEVLVDVPIAPAPDWLLELVRKEEVDPATVVTTADGPKPEEMDPAEWERCNRYAKSVVDAEIERLKRLGVTGWDGEPWNGTTYNVSCTLIEIANSTWNAYTLQHAYNDVFTNAPRDREGFDDEVVNKTFESARGKVGDGARPVPEVRSSEPDPMFMNPEVRRRPTEGGGEPTGPVVGGQVTPYDFFEGKDFLAAKLANAVADVGPIGWGRDRDFWSYSDGVWSPDPEVVTYRMIAFLGDRYRHALLSTVEDICAKHALRISGDPDPDHVNFSNGMLDWRTGELLDHDPKYGSTVQLPVAYDPDATCPKFEAFLDDVMHPDYVKLAWEMLGYLVFSGNPLQVAFLLYGTGGNGKGTLLRVIQKLLGDRNVSNESLDQLNNSTFSAVNLYGKIANIAGDIDATYQEVTANFKKLTGEDMFGAERKYGARFNFESWAVPIFSCNKIPGSSDVTDGYLRRWVVLRFHKRIPKKVPGFSNTLLAELPGIAAKAIPALRELMAREHFAIEGEAAKGREEFAEAIDQVRQWVASGNPLQAPEVETMLVDLYSSYAIWAERSGRRKVTEVEFSHRLEAMDYPLVKRDGLEFHKGLRVQPLSTPRTPAEMFD
jgi:putative DNA primase/helicase